MRTDIQLTFAARTFHQRSLALPVARFLTTGGGFLLRAPERIAWRQAERDALRDSDRIAARARLRTGGA